MPTVLELRLGSRAIERQLQKAGEPKMNMDIILQTGRLIMSNTTTILAYAQTRPDIIRCGSPTLETVDIVRSIFAG